MFNKLTIEDVQEWNRSYKLSSRSYSRLYNYSEEDKIYGIFHYLLKFYWFKDNCIAALDKLVKIAAKKDFLQGKPIKEWLVAEEWLGKRMSDFIIDHNIDFNYSALEIPALDIHIELEPFMPMVVFCEIFKLLYRELELHLPEAGILQPDAIPIEARVKEWLVRI